jgi:hypothetical protein
MRSTPKVWLVAAALGTLACHSMVPLTWSEIATQRPPRVYVTQDGSRVELAGPQVFNDTVVGYINGEFVELPTASLQGVTVRQPARGKTIGLVVASIAAAAGIAVWMSSVGDPAPVQFLDCMDVPDDPRCQGQGGLRLAP